MLLFEKNLGRGISTIIVLMNRLPSPTSSMTCPYTILFQRKPDYFTLRVFGHVASLTCTIMQLISLSFAHCRAFFLVIVSNTKATVVFIIHDVFAYHAMWYSIKNHFPFHNLILILKWRENFLFLMNGWILVTILIITWHII